MTTLFDTSVLIAIAKPEEKFHDWAKQSFSRFKSEGPIVINDVIYAELSISMDSKDHLDQIIFDLGIERAPSTDQSLFNAGKRYLKHLKNGGTRSTVLPDFFIGALGQDNNIPIVTSNPNDFRGFFDGLRIIHPEGEETVVQT